MMKSLLKNAFVRSSTTASLDASSSVPDSGFAFINNSKGASASIVEFADAIDDVFGDIEFEGEASEFAKRELQRLDEEASKYPNSRFITDADQPQWACNTDDAPLLLAAAKCSRATYEQAGIGTPTEDFYRYELLESVTPSMLGTVKATAFYELSLADGGNEGGKVLVIAIKGSASTVDHMVNANSRSASTQDFISFSACQGGVSDQDALKVHSGFLNGARALAPRIAKHLEKTKAPNGPRQVLFAGHSAGAAVASLLFYHSLSTSSEQYPWLSFSCVTFGSPPICDSKFASLANRLREETKTCRFHINFLNEFDLVPCLDKPYVLSLINLYRTKFSLPPIQSEESVVSSTTVGASSSSNIDTTSFWPLPAPVLVHSGEMVLLSLDESLDGEYETGKLRATTISNDVLGSLVYCRLAAHKMDLYLTNLSELLNR